MVKTVIEIIKEVEAGKIELGNSDPLFDERKYDNGVECIHIIHAVEGYEELEVFFAEHEHIQELRQRIGDGETNASELESLVFNEYSDRFNYNKVRYYRIGGYILEKSYDC